jgi:hypothetical protein
MRRRRLVTFFPTGPGEPGMPTAARPPGRAEPTAAPPTAARPPGRADPADALPATPPTTARPRARARPTRGSPGALIRSRPRWGRTPGVRWLGARQCRYSPRQDVAGAPKVCTRGLWDESHVGHKRRPGRRRDPVHTGFGQVEVATDGDRADAQDAYGVLDRRPGRGPAARPPSRRPAAGGRRPAASGSTSATGSRRTSGSPAVRPRPGRTSRRASRGRSPCRRCGVEEERTSQRASRYSMVRAATPRPRATPVRRSVATTCTCARVMTTPMPASMPCTTAGERASAARPRRDRPSTICTRPARATTNYRFVARGQAPAAPLPAQPQPVAV